MKAANKAVILFVVFVVLFGTIMPAFAQPSNPTPSANNPSGIPNENSQATNPTPSMETTPSTESTPTVKVITPEIRAKQDEARKIRERIEDLGRQVGVLSEAYNGASLELTKTADQLKEIESRLHWFQSELQVQKGQINDRVVEIYKSGETDPIELFVNSTSFHDFLVRFNLLVRIGANDVNLLHKIHLQKRKIEEAKAELEGLQGKQLKLTLDLQNKKNEVITKLAEYQNVLAGVDAATKQLLYEEARKEAAEQVTLKTRFSQGINVKPGSVVAVAMQYLGIPYVWGGETPQGGFDCSGLTRYVYLQFGVDMPHWVPYQWDMGISVARGNEQPGDLVFFNNLNHVGIYIGDGYFIQAPRTGDYVKITELSSRKDYMGAKRFIVEIPGR